MESIENKYKASNHYNSAELMSLTHNSSLYELILKNEFSWEGYWQPFYTENDDSTIDLTIAS